MIWTAIGNLFEGRIEMSCISKQMIIEIDKIYEIKLLDNVLKIISIIITRHMQKRNEKN